MEYSSFDFGDADKALLRAQMEKCRTFEALLEHEGFTFPNINLEAVHGKATESIATAVRAQSDADPEMPCLKTACDLIAASFYTSDGRIREILARDNLDMSSYRDVVTTALFIAARKGHAEILSALFTLGIDANSMDSEMTPLLYVAAEENHPNCVQLLLSQGANVNGRSGTNDKTAWVAICGLETHGAVAEILSSHGAEKNVLFGHGEHALYLAAAGGHTDQVWTMLGRGMDPSFTTPYLWCPLHWAASNQHVEIVQLLLDAGADVNNASDTGKTPLDLLADGGKLDTETAELLTSYGAISNINGPRPQRSMQQRRWESMGTPYFYGI